MSEEAIIININRQANESFIDYFVRIYDNRRLYGLSTEDAARLMNQESGEVKGESAWRKEYAAFNRGRLYERGGLGCGAKHRILCISDTHVPFQLPADTFAKYRGLVDTLVLNGDIADCQAISKFPKSYRVSPMEELIETRAYVSELIDTICPSRVVATYGNHDVRFQNYFSKNLDTDILELMPKTSLELIFVDGFTHYDKRRGVKTKYEPLKDTITDVEIDYVDNWYTQIGSTIFCHPLAFSSGMMKTAQRAVDYFRNEGEVFDSLVMAHTHRVGEYYMGNTVMYEQGCCCDTSKLNYADGRLTPQGKQGYIYLCQDSTGKLIRDSVRIEFLK